MIRFSDAESERQAIGYLAGRFSFKTWENGDLLVPEAALSHLATRGVSFLVQGPARYDQNIPTVRDPAAPAV